MSGTEQQMAHDVIQQSLPWYRVPSLVKLYLLLLAPMLTSAAWGFDLSMTNGLQSVEIFMDTFGNPSGATLGFYGASMSVGGIVACLVGGPLNNRFGRRALVFAGSLLVIGMVFLETFAPNFRVFSAAKLILGFGSNLQQLAAPVLVTELAHPRQREALTSIYNTAIFIGLIIGSWITFATFSMPSEWSWKLPCILQVILPLYQAAMIWFCPESPRWLASRGRLDEAHAILTKYHGNGHADDPVVQLEMQEIVAGLEADKTMLRLNKAGIKTVLGSKGNRHRLWLSFWAAIGSQCLGSNFVSTYLPLILDQVGMTTSKEKTLINGIVSIVQWLTAFSAAFLIPRVGRRTIFLGSTSVMTATFIVWTALTATYLRDPQPGYGIGVIVIIFLFSIANAACWIPLVVTYPLEVVTTKQRGIFFSWTMLCINASSFVASYLNPVALEAIQWRYYIVQCVFNSLMIAVIYFTFVETTGRTLEEIAGIFDGDETFENAKAVARAGFEKTAELDAVTHMEESGSRKA
ncbi:putative MFS hexose transporter [Plectosphaerella cucumerina]|uniref:MFS hexose transporter n=1 Tax=Plectosphaerella cucumerina TaxID=40658 RepID=A0A8K0TH40_9PEZI|nr:putative MFS hexose transporter [Plectosphaerella cucumerina]